MISDFALTADNPLHCVLAGGTGGGGGKWTGPDNTTSAVQCSRGSGPFTCSQSSDPTDITLLQEYCRSFILRETASTHVLSVDHSISVQI